MPRKTKRTVRTKKGIRAYTYLGCPLTKNRTAWCFHLCVPDADGKGQCGRVAPHGLTGRTQHAIQEHSRRLRQARLEALESAYLGRPDTEGHEPGVRVSEGEAEVVLHLGGRERGETAAVPPRLCFETMHDSAHLAVASLTEDETVATLEFNVKLTGVPAGGMLVARSVFVGMADDHFRTQSILGDGADRELGRATGVFAVKS